MPEYSGKAQKNGNSTITYLIYVRSDASGVRPLHFKREQG